MKVQAVMTSIVITVSPETSLKEIAGILAKHKISGVPVLARDGEVVGVVSEADILFKERGPSERRGMFAWLLEPNAVQEQLKLEARTAAEAMTAPAQTIAPWCSVSTAAAQMLDEHVNRLPVVDSDGRLVGIVTRADLVRAFVRTDAEIEREIREQVLRQALWLETPDTVTVEVDSGRVTLGGSVDTRANAELVSALVAKTPGVVDVESAIGWLENGGGRR
jgi:CBS-domain-containing membrane protein